VPNDQSTEADQLRAELKDIDVNELALDPENPRLPRQLHGLSQSQLLRYLFDNGVLDELGKSFLDNGYFMHEPVIATPAGIENRPYVVLEGNRRLAALLILLQAEVAKEAGVRFNLEREPTNAERTALARIPSYVVPDRESVHRFLGFRHIGGIKTWSAEAKARYLFGEVEKIAASNGHDVFVAIGRRVGSNALGVRNSYVAYATMRQATDEFGLDAEFVVNNRFGVWLRALNSPELRQFVGLDPQATTYEQVRASLSTLDRSGLAEIIADLTPRAQGEKAVLYDSRDVTIYAQVLSNPTAHAALRRFDDLQVARQVVERAELPARIRSYTRQLDLVRDEVQRSEPDRDLLESIDGLVAVARAIRSIARDRVQDETDDD
jgi:hypothetical protein